MACRWSTCCQGRWRRNLVSISVTPSRDLLAASSPGFAFIVPAFVIMLALSWVYALFGSFAVARNSLYGIGPVVVGIFAVSVYRLAKGTIRNKVQVLIGSDRNGARCCSYRSGFG